jgi:hypothetical protein
MRKSKSVQPTKFVSAGSWEIIKENPDTGYAQVLNKKENLKIWIPKQWVLDFNELTNKVGFYRQSSTYYKNLKEEMEELELQLTFSKRSTQMWKTISFSLLTLIVMLAIVLKSV